VVEVGSSSAGDVLFSESSGKEVLLVHPRSILQNDVESMDDTRDVTEDGEQDVDEEISVASSLEEDTQRREDNGNNDFADVRCGERHVGGSLRDCNVRCACFDRCN